MRYFTMTLLTAALLTGTAMAAQSVPVVTGGVGEASQAALEQVQSGYSLKLVFTDQSGAYLADVAVRIEDKNGREVLSGSTQGPLLLAALEPGRYTVNAAIDGMVKTRTVTVGENLKTYQIQFPVKDENRISLRDRLKDKGYNVTMSFPG